jgi:hypothetical protein
LVIALLGLLGYIFFGFGIGYALTILAGFFTVLGLALVLGFYLIG